MECKKFVWYAMWEIRGTFGFLTRKTYDFSIAALLDQPFIRANQLMLCQLVPYIINILL